MPAQSKIEAVALLREKFEGAKSLIIADYRGLNVPEISELRARARAASVELLVAKNRLAKRALGELELPTLDDVLVGPSIFAMGSEDPVSPAKVLNEFAKSSEHLEIKGGLFEGKALTAEDVKRLASMPSREDLYGRLAGSLAAPATNIARTIDAVISGLARVIRAAAETREAA
ncbi:50S ribosomal protein L10 [Candidatus Sumerlaeota bacterium]|nr:50S ribosomal protein L10 [Candidatus Sumerlaeota bacterium]